MYLQLLASRPRFIQATALGLFLIVGLLLLQRQHAYRPMPFTDADLVPDYRPAVPRIAKVSMLYGKANALYERAIASHERHSAIHGYPVHVLTVELQTNYWNKPAYIMSRLLREMEKKPGDRVEWLLWFDADSIIMNLDMPLETYLPPNDKMFQHTHLLVTKDGNGLNTGLFFLRVNEWAIRFMAKTMAFPMYRPDVDLGFSEDQKAMELLINETDFRANTTYIPRPWINAFVNECQPGDLVVHFPGLIDRDFHIKYWLNRIEGPEAPNWRKKVQDTQYPGEVSNFWQTVRECMEASHELGVRMKKIDNLAQESVTDLNYLIDACWYLSDKKEIYHEIKDAARKAVDALPDPAAADKPPGR